MLQYLFLYTLNKLASTTGENPTAWPYGEGYDSVLFLSQSTFDNMQQIGEGIT